MPAHKGYIRATLHGPDRPDDWREQAECTTPAPSSGAGPDLGALHETICDKFTGMAEVQQAADLLVAEVRRLTTEAATQREWFEAADTAAERRLDQSIAWMERAESAEAEVRRLTADLDMSQRLLATMDHWAEVAETCELKANESHARRESAEAEVVTLRARLAAVEDLHWKVGGACSHCSQRSDYAVAWPCETAVALAGTTGEGQ